MAQETAMDNETAKLKLEEAASYDREAMKREQLFFHSSPKPDACDHDFRGWRNFHDGNGGEQVCAKCGMGAMAYSLRVSD